jgi:tetratricopeptide (TPR) repeat protein
MLKKLTDRAINSALTQDWHEAIEINLEILDQEPYHIPTLNRLAKAYKETGQIEKAVQTYKQALELDRFNEIARKNLTLLEKKQPNGNHYHTCSFNADFVDEPGRTRTIPLIRLGDPGLVHTLQPGQVVRLSVKKRSICVVTDNDEHIGALTDDMTYHLRNFLVAGNIYHVAIKSASVKAIYVFIKEIERASKYKDTPTFSPI